MIFRLTMYPALDGDCLLISWGAACDLRHIILDFGRGVTYKQVRDRLAQLGKLELLVMSHIDADHIAGAIPMVREKAAPFNPHRVWYNARPQLVAAENRASAIESLGARQAEKFARGIVKFGWPWNRDFTSGIVSTDSSEARLPIPLGGGLTIRLLSPNDTGLIMLLPKWNAELKKANLQTFTPDEGDNPLGPEFESFGALSVQNLAAQEYVADRTEPNGAAIAFIAEFNGKRILLAADAHSDVLESALKPLAEAEGGRYRLDLLKVSHHGSKANTSKALPGLLKCSRFAFSTNGDRHNHPDPETIARFLVLDKDRKKFLYFNYRQPRTEIWDNLRLKAKWNYECVFPANEKSHPDNGWLSIDV